MFNKDFYPTPNDVIEQMLLGVDLRNKVVLEPSAGKGNIVDYLKENGAKEVLACEANPDLAKIVASKCRLLAGDFLQVESTDISHIDMIVMNPPFSADETHILHAWDIAPAGCAIIALCNSNTLRNPHTAKREQLAELIRVNGRHEDFSSCFDDAERKTGVDISCIWLYKPATENEDEFADYFSLDEEMEQQGDGVIRYDYIRNIVSRYTGAVKLFNEVMEVSNRMNSLTNPIHEYGIKFGAFRTGGERNYQDNMVTRDEYKKELQKKCWERVFADMKMDKYVTKGVKENINKFVEQQVHVPFTMKNIYKMLELIVGTHGSRMTQVLVEAFEMICNFSADNSTAGEKWKTNSDYVINRRFIIPHICEVNSYSRDNNVEICYRSAEKTEDIVKALCFMTGKNYDDIQPIRSFANNIHNNKSDDHKAYARMEWGKWYEWGFFRIRGYKKGTMHFEFLDENVLDLFNRRVAEIKGWRLPKTTKKARAKRTDVATA